MMKEEGEKTDIENVKKWADMWMNNICVRCETKMDVKDGEISCPKCTPKLSMWNPSHNAMLKIAMEVGSMWIGTGCVNDGKKADNNMRGIARLD